jgi:plasmid maintenance system antidote protein VapI
MGIGDSYVIRALGVSEQELGNLLIGAHPIDWDMALELDSLFGYSPEFWAKREENFLNELERQGLDRPAPIG